MQTRSDRLNEDVLGLNDECKLRARALSRCAGINADINIARVATRNVYLLPFFLAVLYVEDTMAPRIARFCVLRITGAFG